MQRVPAYAPSETYSGLSACSIPRLARGARAMTPRFFTIDRKGSAFSRAAPPGAIKLCLAAGAALTVGLSGPAALPQARRIELNDYARIVTVSDPQISPDGKSIACVVSRRNLERDRSDRELVLLD